MPSIAALTIYAFGITSLVAGIYNLIFPKSALRSLGLSESALPASNGLALAATAMGLYYILLAHQENRSFFLLTVPMRLTTATVFLRQGHSWTLAGLWEGTGAVLTMMAMAWESTR